MNKTTRILIIGGAVAVTAVAAYRLIPVVRDLAAAVRTLRLVVDTESPDEGEPEDFVVKVSDPEVLRRIDEAIEKYPEGWITRERPVRKSQPSDDEPLVTGAE
jgi:hypothetical protein